MNFSTSTVTSELAKQVVNSFMSVVEEGTKEFARMAWSFTTSFLIEHWLLISGLFSVLLFLLILKAILGQWGSLYSLTYWTLYAFVIFVIGLIWGPEALVSDFFNIVYIIAIWPICYLLTGWIWNRFDFRKRL